MVETYDLFQKGREQLEDGMAAQATVSLEKAKRREPDKASIREAPGHAYFPTCAGSEAEAEFRRARDLADGRLAHYALAASRRLAGRDAEANGHYKLASALRPVGSTTSTDHGPR